MDPFLPDDVKKWLFSLFAGCNDRVARKISRIGNAWETSLDMTFIEHFTQVAAPHAFGSGWRARISTYYLGGRRHWGNWEIADIAITGMFFRGDQLLRTKTAVLQSKRLYPHEIVSAEDSRETYKAGLEGFFFGDFPSDDARAERSLTFGTDSVYRSLITGNDQYEAVASYEEQTKMPVFYLLYNPLVLPWSVELPVEGDATIGVHNEVGARVIPAKEVRATLKAKGENHVPSYGELVPAMHFPPNGGATGAGWPLEHFVVNLVLGCLQGHRSDQPQQDEVMATMFRRRQGAMAAAVNIRFDVP